MLKGPAWRKIESSADLHLAQHSSFDELPLVIPISVFVNPANVSAAAGDGEILVGYGLRSEGESPDDSLDEMLLNKRYSVLWEAVTGNKLPEAGLKSPNVTLCIKTAEIEIFPRTGGFHSSPFAE